MTTICLFVAPVAGWAVKSGRDVRCGEHPLKPTHYSTQVDEYCLANWLAEILKRHRVYDRVILVDAGRLSDASRTRLKGFASSCDCLLEIVTPRQVKRIACGPYCTKAELRMWAGAKVKGRVEYAAAVAVGGIHCPAVR